MGKQRIWTVNVYEEQENGKNKKLLAVGIIYKYEFFGLKWFRIRSDGAYIRHPYWDDDHDYNRAVSVAERQAKIEARKILDEYKMTGRIKQNTTK